MIFPPSRSNLGLPDQSYAPGSSTPMLIAHSGAVLDLNPLYLLEYLEAPAGRNGAPEPWLLPLLVPCILAAWLR